MKNKLKFKIQGSQIKASKCKSYYKEKKKYNHIFIVDLIKKDGLYFSKINVLN